jgi:hypothetical protein
MLVYLLRRKSLRNKGWKTNESFQKQKYVNKNKNRQNCAD